MKDLMMNDFRPTNPSGFDSFRSNVGFTLMELMVTLALTSIIIAVIYSAYTLQQRTFRRETLVVAAQQNARSALFLMENEIRMAGYDRHNTDLFGITDIRLDAAGNGTLSFTADNGEVSGFDNHTVDNSEENYVFSLYDAGSTVAVGNLDLGRSIDGGANTSLVAEGIEALGFAFAFDDDADGQLDTSAGGNVIWAVDSDGDNALDTSLDNDDDGDIDEDDDGNNDLVIDDNDGALPSTVNIDRIRAVKVFILARTKSPDFGFNDTSTYVVGSRIVDPPAGDSFRRRLLSTTVKCRNIGL
jgi:type IV pilus assembly protein PilW